jgi:hypothetical protein
MGARYAGCSTEGLGIAGHRSMMGGAGMMGGGYYNNGGWGAMMSSSDWSCMMGGTWQHMSRQDWRQLQQRLLGTSTMNHHSRWSGLAIVGATLPPPSSCSSRSSRSPAAGPASARHAAPSSPMRSGSSPRLAS